ncbi:MAG TPA: UbiA family prenyltransferase, partial [Ignavibacteriales bacterium]|nr:UbiA family prenyltransferase [Ignavibacteriales bacterium]
MLRKKISKYLNVFLELGKVRITFFVAVTASAGYILSSGRIDSAMVLPVLGIFILSCGSSAFNHYQERHTDKLMDRTKGRPLPAGIVSARAGFMFAFSASLIGLAMLYFFSSITAFLLGVLALFWYNILYTPMKRVTALAVVPGALIGSIPPAIGWVAAGGELADPRVWALALFFF